VSLSIRVVLGFDDQVLCNILGPLGFNFSQHSSTTRPSVERTAEKAFLLQYGTVASTNPHGRTNSIDFDLFPLYQDWDLS